MSGLTERQKEFARGVFEGLSQRVAYKRAYDCTKKKDKTVDELASRLSSNVKVKEYLASLNKEVERSAVLSKQERMEWLSRVVRTPLSKVDADSDLCQ
ncbi:MAG: terminase small subunit, partial [Akkermansia sp.]